MAKKISQLTAGSPPYDPDSLIEVAVVGVGSRKVKLREALSGSPVSSTYDGEGVIPASTSAGFVIAANYAADGAVDFWNTAELDGGFKFRQKSGPGASRTIGALYGDGTFAELDVLANTDGTIGGYFYVDATGFFLGGNSGVDGFKYQVALGADHEFQTNGQRRAAINDFGMAFKSRSAFGDLPTVPAGEVMLAVVTDSTVNAWGATVAGSGSNVVLALGDDTQAWTVVGKTSV